jgi:polar amino acid transport system substrate-binding protein
MKHCALWMRVASLALAVLLFGAPARADQLRLVYEDFPPFEYMERGEARGECVELVRRVCQRLGLTPVFLHRPWARAMDDVRVGHVDGIFSLFRTADRARAMHYADTPLAYDETVVFVADARLRPESLDDLTGLRVGAIRGYYYGLGVAEQLPVDTDRFKDMETLLRMLGEGRIDAAVATRRSGEYVLARLGYAAEVRVALVLARLPLYIAFSRSDDARGRRLAEAFGRELALLAAEAEGTAR